MKSVDEVLGLIAEIDGWLSDDQARDLYQAAAACRSSGRIVEIGSFRGRSTVVLAAASDPTVEVIAIDPHAGNDRGPGEISGFGDAANDDHAAFVRNIDEAGVAGRIKHLRQFSHEARSSIGGDIDVLYIDGAHRYSHARADIAEYGPMVVTDGVMLIHDSFSSIGVTAAIARELFMSKRWRFVGRTRSLALYRVADEQPSLRNSLRQLAQLPWFAKNVALKLMLTLGWERLARRLGRPVPEWPY